MNINNTEFTKLFYFVFCNDVLLKDTRYTMMAIMEYQNIFGLEETFKLYPKTIKTMFNIKNKTLDRCIEYLSEREWIDAKKYEGHYLIKINYDFLNSVRDKYILKKKNNKLEY